MKRIRLAPGVVAAAFLAMATFGLAAPAAAEAPVEGYVAVNGVTLEYLDWGGAGPPLILVPGTVDNPHVFDDLAPSLRAFRHVIGFSRRGAGNSEAKGPYDIATLTSDLVGFMDALRIRKADLVGYSAGGVEVTQVAANFPDRVQHVIYFDSAYVWNGGWAPYPPKGKLPDYFTPPATAMASLNDYLEYYHATYYPALGRIDPLTANLREKVAISPDGRVSFRLSQDELGKIITAWEANPPLDFAKIKCPVLAIYAQHASDLRTDKDARASQLSYEQHYWRPWQERSVRAMKQYIPSVQIATLPGGHGDFIIISREKLTDLLKEFLSGQHKS
jgi:pimeloyl-ACP methyl ester carboxylesterase